MFKELPKNGICELCGNHLKDHWQGCPPKAEELSTPFTSDGNIKPKFDPLQELIGKAGESFDKKWWYDIPNLRLCSKDIPCYDEDDNLVGYNQHGAAVPRDIKSFLSTQIEQAYNQGQQDFISEIKLTNMITLEFAKSVCKKYGIEVNESVENTLKLFTNCKVYNSDKPLWEQPKNCGCLLCLMITTQKLKN